MPYADPDRQREYQRKWLKRRREDWLAANGPCADCGSWTNLDVDHIDPMKKLSHRVWSWAEPRRSAELAKCQVLCEPCHIAKTHRDNGFNEHGSRSQYDRHGCRCVECRATHARTAREQRRRHKNG